MNQFTNPAVAAPSDAGLRTFMLGTYRYMMIAMAISGAAAWLMSRLVLTDGAPNELFYTIYASPIRWALWLAPMAFVWFMGRKYMSMSPAGARTVLFVYSALIGIWLASLLIYLVISAPMLGAKIMFMSIAMFAGLSIVGYMTKKNLSALGTFAYMAFFGVILASVLGIILGSSLVVIIASAIGLVLIAIITAWQTQELKTMYYATQGDTAEAEKASAFGALALYTSFINIFILLFNLFSSFGE